jgi:hypothetical protein
MRIRRTLGWATAVLTLVCSASASAQTAPPIAGTTTTSDTTTIAGTLSGIVVPSGTAHVGDALGLASQLGVATMPYGAASGGFLIKLDPSTGLQVRAATTFGPAFAERALTSGEGKLSLGANFLAATFDRLDDQVVDNNLQLRTSPGTTPANTRNGTASLTLTSRTTVAYARMGISDNFDVGVNVPLVAVKLTGTSLLSNAAGGILFAQGVATKSGLGDVQGIAKYRFHAFGTELPDPGGLALMVTMTLPTGDKDNFLGLGVTRTKLSFIASGGQGRLSPHANVGFEYWSKGLSVASDASPGTTVTARHQFDFAGGIELQAVPKLTILLDLVGGGVLGGGKVGFVTVPPDAPTISSSQALSALSEGIRKVDLAPGLKANLKGKLLISLNALIALHDSGLHARVTPVAGIDLTF